MWAQNNPNLFAKFTEVPTTPSPDPKQVVSSEEVFKSHAVSQETLTRLLVQTGIFTKEGF
jgi:hypothetical protein